MLRFVTSFTSAFLSFTLSITAGPGLRLPDHRLHFAALHFVILRELTTRHHFAPHPRYNARLFHIMPYIYIVWSKNARRPIWSDLNASKPHLLKCVRCVRCGQWDWSYRHRSLELVACAFYLLHNFPAIVWMIGFIFSFFFSSLFRRYAFALLCLVLPCFAFISSVGPLKNCVRRMQQ